MLFYNDYEDLQLSSFTANPDTGVFEALFTNAGKATIKGLELELTALVTAGLKLEWVIGYQDSEYDEYMKKKEDDSGQPEQVADVSDQHELVNTPKWASRIGLQYSLPIKAMGEMIFASDLSYCSKVYPTVSSSEVLAQEGYSLVNAGITYLSVNQHWRVMLGGKNLSDKQYIKHGFDLSDSLEYQLAYYGAPRTYSLSANYSY